VIKSLLDAGVSLQALDDLERDEVAVRVPPLRAAPLRVGERRADQIGAGPVIELPVRDPDELAHLRAAEALLARGLCPQLAVAALRGPVVRVRHGSPPRWSSALEVAGS